MSRTADPDLDPAELPDPVCEFCGGGIEKTDPECPARDEEVCAP